MVGSIPLLVQRPPDSYTQVLRETMADDVASDGGNDLQTPYRKFIIIIEYRDVDLSDRGENNSDGGDVFDRCSDDEDDCYVGMEYPIVTSNEGHITVKITMQRDTDTQQSCNNLR